MRNTTKYITRLFCCLIFSLNSCSDNEIAEYPILEELTISLDKEEYSCAIGDIIYIEPEISGDIPQSDLSFYWEVGHGEGYGGNATFTPVACTRNLDMECRLGELFPTPGTYTLRVRVKQASNGRDFYSSHFKLKITGRTGLLALYSDNGQSDIALIRDITDSNSAVHHRFYSEANGGRKIPGTGRFLTQLQGGSASYSNYHSIIAVTDKSGIGANYLTMEEIPGGWNAILFKGAFNRGIPENIIYSSENPMAQFQEIYIIDGGEIYGRQNSEFVLRPAIGTSSNAYIDFYDIAPYAYVSHGGNYQVWLFDKKSQAFVGVTNIISVFMNGAADAGAVAKVFTPGGKFNPSRMKADLVYMAEGGQANHLLAVMKKADGNLFVAELDTAPADMSGTAKAIYELDTSCTGDPLGYDFCSHSPSRECCYLYTADNIYRLNIGGNSTSPSPQPITWPENTSAISADEKITAMATLSFSGVNIMVVATWNGKTADVKSFTIDSNSGNPTRLLSSYDIPGKIAAFHIKHI